MRVPSATFPAMNVIIERLRLPGLFALFLMWSFPLLAEDTFYRDDLEEVFRTHTTDGTFVLYDVSKDTLTVVGATRAGTRFIPASTFKVANSLIALDLGVVTDEDEVVPYGGKPQPFKAWEKDMSLREAIRVSNVPVFQEVARRVGLGQYQRYLEVLAYGNQQTGTDVEHFWLKGPLEISALEQVRFLASLAQETLPISSKSQKAVRDILRTDHSGQSTLYAKSGWTNTPSPDLGWYVGWVERSDELYVFALNIDIHSRSDAKLRKQLAFEFLSAFGIF